MEPERPRALTGLVNQSLAQKKNRPLEIAPLATPIAPIGGVPLSQSTAPPVGVLPASGAPRAALSSSDLRAMLASRTKLREVAFLTELLQPPLALRRPRRPF
jgi:hypothetical protein